MSGSASRPGAWADRIRRRPVMTAVGLLRPVLLLSVSASWLLDALSIEQFVAQLPVEAEVREGYNGQREFGDWIDADKDGCNTRAEVLIEEAVEAPMPANGSASAPPQESA